MQAMDELRDINELEMSWNHKKLTAEQVRKAVNNHGNIMNNRLYENWQRVADELNETLDGVNPDGLPGGLTISDDGKLLNWRGENYIRQSTLGNKKLTIEQVINAIFNGSVYASYDGTQYYASGINMQAITDKLNVALVENGRNNNGNLKSCPFCGGNSDFVKLKTYCDEKTFYKVACNDYNCLGANINKWFSSKHDAAKAWNF